MTESDVTELDVTPVPGKPNLLLGAFDLATLGYRAEEFFVSGRASSYAPVGDLGPDGRWSAQPWSTADFTTRIVALTPTSGFNGTVIVEWLNVSGGIDAPAVWFMAHRELVRQGYAYVAVSAQSVGIEGGGVTLVANFSLKTMDPQRYSRLSHPGDAFCYDIYSQIGRLVSDGDRGVLGGLQPEVVLAVGESQSAMFLTTYVNAVDPLARVYDGFLVHSRFGSAAPLDGATILDPSSQALALPVQFRSDLRVPVVTVITETDLVGAVLPGYRLARQPDDEWLRIWEIPGAAHADNYTIQVAFIDSGSAPVADIVAAYAPTDSLMGQKLAHFINFAPQHHYVVQAAVAGLHRWARDDEPAPHAERIVLSDGGQLVLDEKGLAQGGIRTPWVDVPAARTSGVVSGAGSDAGGDEGIDVTDEGTDVAVENVMARIFGSGEPFDSGTLSRLYPGGAEEYLAQFTQALDRAIAAGFILAADREEILELAAATYPRGPGGSRPDG